LRGVDILGFVEAQVRMNATIHQTSRGQTRPSKRGFERTAACSNGPRHGYQQMTPVESDDIR